MIYDDLQDDMDLEYKKSEKLSLESMEEAVVQAEKGTSIDPSLAMKALLLRENFNEMKQRQQAQKEQRQKLLKAAAGPLLSYLAKLILPLFAL